MKYEKAGYNEAYINESPVIVTVEAVPVVAGKENYNVFKTTDVFGADTTPEYIVVFTDQVDLLYLVSNNKGNLLAVKLLVDNSTIRRYAVILENGTPITAYTVGAAAVLARSYKKEA